MNQLERGYNLLHPLYLDIPMMVSFLAHLEGGVVIEEEQTSRQSGARERLLKGRAGLRARFGPLVSGDVGAEGSTQHKDEDSLESKTNRHHTAASLFNLLYSYLVEDEQLALIEEAADLNTLKSGQLVELAGEYLGNPLEESLAALGAVFPYLQAQREAEAGAQAEQQKRQRGVQRSKRNANQRSSSQTDEDAEAAALAALTELVQQAEAQAQEVGLMIIRQMAEDINKVPVHDVLVRTNGGVNAVLTVDSAFYTPTTNEYLRAGEFRVVGKVTRVLRDDRSINLTRRTVIGVTQPETAREMLSGLTGNEGISLDLADPIVVAPGLQILPMAIYV